MVCNHETFNNPEGKQLVKMQEAQARFQHKDNYEQSLATSSF